MEYLNQLQNNLIKRNVIREQNVIILGGEIFRKIKGYENYVVSNFGNVKNTKSGHILKPGKRIGYDYVNLCKNGNKKHMNIHRLVANSFITNPLNKPFVDHIDNNKTNNNMNNLRWCTSQENNRNSSIGKCNTSKVKGVHFDKNANKWRARIRIDGINTHIGLFDNIEDAKNARIKKANEVFGVFTNKCEQK